MTSERKRWVVLGCIAAHLAGTILAGASVNEKPLLLQQPSLSQSQLVFVFAGDLWTAEKDGGNARQLTTAVGIKKDPVFSPDGSLIAFTGQYDGNTDVYVVSSSGGIPRRLTYHPGKDEVVCWTPDGKKILFRSDRADFSANVDKTVKFFTVSPNGGFQEEIPLPSGTQASYSPDGRLLAYVPTKQDQKAWKRYRGGQAFTIWIADLSDLKIEKIPRDNSNDFNPMWIGNKIYFLSDRKGSVALFAYDLKTKTVEEAVPNNGFDFKSASAGPGGVVIEQFGALLFYKTATGKARKLSITLNGDFPEVRPRYVNVGQRIAAASISPEGARAVFEARGEILTVPAEKGDIRNLTRTTGVMERSPAWSPSGKWIAYFSDATGEYALHIIDQSGMGPEKVIRLGDQASFYYNPVWSPDSRKIVFNDNHLTLWYLDITAGVPIKVDTSWYFNPNFAFDAGWSPDSRWLTYTRELPNHMNAIFVYSIDTAKTVQITDGLCDARYSVFDKSGKYLFFAASTNAALTRGWLDMTSEDRHVTRSVYLAFLRKDLLSPLAPESDEEKACEPEKAPRKNDSCEGNAARIPSGVNLVTIDLEDIDHRILALPLPPKNYIALAAGKEGKIFIQEEPIIIDLSSRENAGGLYRFDLNRQSLEKILDGIDSFKMSSSGNKILIRQSGRWIISGAEEPGPINPEKGLLKTENMEVFIEPLAEWRQMYHEAWRVEREFFYDPGFHGLDLKKAEARYAPFVDSLTSRRDLNYLFEEMLGELTCGHIFINEGDVPEMKRVDVGLLGADFKVENGRYRFLRVYNGESWNPELRAPLAQHGGNVKAGEYLLSVNGRDVRASEDVYMFFEATVEKQVKLRIGPNPDGTGAREVTVVPIASEVNLRNLAWIADNKRKVDALSGGRLAYVWIADTRVRGYWNFNRYYFAQIGKEGAIIDERYNGGGLIADYLIDYMRRPLLGYFTSRDGSDTATPAESIYGPKVMIINEDAGSGGDMLPWLFRAAGIGPLIGTTTWGGVVGWRSGAPLMDGGRVGAPHSGFWNPNGTWDVENHGVVPDLEVVMEPALVRTGHDPQLEKAVAVALDLLSKNPPPKYKKPTYPVYKRSW